MEQNYHQVRKRIKNSLEGSLEAWKQIHRTYPLIYRLARTVQTLPYSTSSIERNFSVLKDMKTIKRTDYQFKIGSLSPFKARVFSQ